MPIKQMIIYPFDENAEIMVYEDSFLSRFSQLEKIYLCSPRGWRRQCEMIGKYQENLKYEVSYMPFDECIDTADAVVFVECEDENLIKPRIEMAAEKGVVIYDLAYDEHKRSELKCKCERNGGKYFSFRNNVHSEGYIIKPGSELLELKTPLIAVGSQVCSLGQEFLEYGLKGYFKKKGYNVTLVSSCNYVHISEDYGIPAFMRDNSYSDAEKILMFNRFLKNVENENNPDAIILGIPEEMMVYTNGLYGNFAMMAHKILYATKPDYFIYCMPYDCYNKELFNSVIKCIEYRFGISVDGISLSKKQVDWMTIENAYPTKVPFISVSENSVDELISILEENGDLTVYAHMRERDVEKLGNNIASVLSQGRRDLVF